MLILEDGLLLGKGFLGLGVDDHLGTVGQSDDHIVDAPEELVLG